MIGHTQTSRDLLGSHILDTIRANPNISTITTPTPPHILPSKVTEDCGLDSRSSTMSGTFHLFPTLPHEIRRIVWFYVLHEPRNTTIRKSKSYDGVLNFPGRLLCFHPCTLPPAATQVCSESRSEALRVYTRAFTYGIAPRYTYTSTLNSTGSSFLIVTSLLMYHFRRKSVATFATWLLHAMNLISSMVVSLQAVQRER